VSSRNLWVKQVNDSLQAIAETRDNEVESELCEMGGSIWN